MKMSKKKKLFFLSLLIIILDRGTKLGAIYFLKDRESPQVVIPGLLNFIYCTNKGALFGFFNNLSDPVRFVLLTIFPTLITLTIFLMLLKANVKEAILNIGLSIILGGAMGNLIDRIFYGKVIDFIDWHFKGYHWHTFNVADASISLGIGMILYHILFVRSEAH